MKATSARKTVEAKFHTKCCREKNARGAEHNFGSCARTIKAKSRAILWATQTILCKGSYDTEPRGWIGFTRGLACNMIGESCSYMTKWNGNRDSWSHWSILASYWNVPLYAVAGRWRGAEELRDKVRVLRICCGGVPRKSLCRYNRGYRSCEQKFV